MIKRIRIKDYMAHKDTDLELDPGVTVLTGPNNSGKSAVVEALRSVAQNPPPHHVIRHGASQAAVRLELDSGEAVEWARSKNNSVYRLYRAAGDAGASGKEPEVYAKFGRTPPDDVRRLLRLDLVETESGGVDIHIGNQRYPIFLLDQTGSQAASFFAASTEAEYLLRIQQALKSKTDRARSRAKELHRECAELEAVLEHYARLPELEMDLVAVETLHAGLLAAQQALPQLERTIEVLDKMGRQVGEKAGASTILKELEPPPQLEETRRLELSLQDLGGVLLQSAIVAAGATALSSLSGPPVLDDTARLETLIRAWESDETSLNDRLLAGESLEGLPAPPELLAVTPLQTLSGQLYAAGDSFRQCAFRGEVLQALSTPPEIQPIKRLDEVAAAMNDVQKRLQDARQLGGLLAGLTAAPELQAAAPGDELLKRMSVLQGQLNVNTRLQEELASAITVKRREIEQVIQKLGLCPLCGQVLDMEHFLEMAHD